MKPDLVYTVLFYLLAAASVLLAVAVVSSRILLRAAVYLMGVLLLSAGLYIMLGAEFLAGVQVLVYVGGIVVLIVFAIMLTRSAELLEDRPSPLRQAIGAFGALCFFALTAGILYSSPFVVDHGGQGPKINDVKLVGQRLLDYGAGGYVLPFEIISVLLLAAMIGGIVVARKTLPLDRPLPPGGRRLDDRAGRPSTHNGRGDGK
jgi:NADH-quinone oxidoreductase subunit J